MADISSFHCSRCKLEFFPQDGGVCFGCNQYFCGKHISLHKVTSQELRPFCDECGSAEIQTVTLYRPVGEHEMKLIADFEFKKYPPRLPSQPIFYPVITEEYAIIIARDWNTKSEASGFAGYVTRFKVRADFLVRYEVHLVGSSIHLEYWIPAQELEELNRNIVGTIEVIHEFH